MILKQIKYFILFLLTLLLGVQTIYAKTELILPQNQVYFSIEQSQSVKSLEKEVQPNVGFLKEKVRFVTVQSVSAQNTYFFSERVGEGLAEAGGKLDNLILRLDNLELTNLKLKLNDLDEAAKIRLANDLDGLSDNAIKQLEDNFGLLDEWKQIDALSVSAQASQKPIWLQKILDGNEFNTIRSSSYPNNEVYLINPNNPNKYVRLDSYKHLDEIVSRKYTQFADIQESTGIKYIQELKDKYPPGTKIADVPSNKAGGSNASLENITEIDGKMILEIPVQNNPIPPSVLYEANSWGIIIRDVQGTIY